jgi:hypothetical protein
MALPLRNVDTSKGREEQAPMMQGDFSQGIGKPCFPLVLVTGAPLKGYVRKGMYSSAKSLHKIADEPSPRKIGSLPSLSQIPFPLLNLVELFALTSWPLLQFTSLGCISTNSVGGSRKTFLPPTLHSGACNHC